MSTSPHFLLVLPTCPLGVSEEATVARALIQALRQVESRLEVLSGSTLGIAGEVDLVDWLAGRGVPEADRGRGTLVARDAQGKAIGEAPYLRTTAMGVPLTIHRGPSVLPHESDEGERAEFRRLFDALIDRSRPDVVLVVGDGSTARDALAAARGRGIATVALAGGHAARERGRFDAVDVVIAPTEDAAAFLRVAFGVRAEVLPLPVDPERIRAGRDEAAYLTCFDPTIEHGVFALARIAEMLGRSRPDIPILVVEGEGTEATLAGCGLDLARSGNVHLMTRPEDPRVAWGFTRACLLPSLGWGDHSGMATAVAALINGVPLIAADRGGLPEIVGGAGMSLALPNWMTPATRHVPTEGEVAAWVDAVIRLWDDATFAESCRLDGLARVPRWDAAALGMRYHRLLVETAERGREAGAGPTADPRIASARARSIVLVPHLNGIEWECEQGLRQLEQAGIKVWRRGGSSAIDMARSLMISEALHDGYDSIMFIDADIGFEPADALRLPALPEPAVCGIYAKKGDRALATHFADEVAEVLFGPEAPGLYPVHYAATGFLRVKATLLRRLINELPLPLCNTKWGRGLWPFFLPLIVPHDGDKLHYLGEDWAFSHRLGQVEVMTLADTSVRLWHWGRYGYGWEDAGSEKPRYRSYNFRLGKK